VEPIWARRKVGFMLDEIRANGEKKELVDEVVLLAKKYGITTPYTSYLIVPDGPMPVVPAVRGGGRIPMPALPGGGGVPPGLAPAAGVPATKVTDFARRVQEKPGDLAANRDRLETERLKGFKGGDKDDGSRVIEEAKNKKEALDKAQEALRLRNQSEVQAGKLGVDLSLQTNNLRNQERLEYTAQRNVNGRSCMEIGGVWIDEKFDAKMPTVVVKAQSDAYFRILERHAKVRDVFKLGNHIVWVAPNGAALVIDTNDGKEKLSDEEIDKLFVAKK
jgi:Ca-activated chloride channel family protein